MGQSIPFKCPVDGCRFHRQVSHADIFQIKWHLKHGHGYGELLETAVELGIIRDETERRNPDWLTERLFQYVQRMKNEPSVN